MAGINLSDLPPKYQQQAMKQLVERMQKKQAAAEQPARSKYGNVKTGRDALRFDSKKEARRFDEPARSKTCDFRWSSPCRPHTPHRAGSGSAPSDIWPTLHIIAGAGAPGIMWWRM